VAYQREPSAEGPSVVPNVWHEHAVYLHYICAFYHRLPPLTAFLHGHRTSWHNRERPAIAQLKHLPLARLAKANGVYYSFNNGIVVSSSCYTYIPIYQAMDSSTTHHS